MQIVRDRNVTIPFSLHDSKIIKFACDKNGLIMHVDRLFEYLPDGENMYEATISFADVDLDTCDVYVFDSVVDEGPFTGKYMNLVDYMEEYQDGQFEILIEGYYGYRTIFQGWIWRKGKAPVSGMINIWNKGDMVYQIGEKIC